MPPKGTSILLMKLVWIYSVKLVSHRCQVAEWQSKWRGAVQRHMRPSNAARSLANSMARGVIWLDFFLILFRWKIKPGVICHTQPSWMQLRLLQCSSKNMLQPFLLMTKKWALFAMIHFWLDLQVPTLNIVQLWPQPYVAICRAQFT